MYALAQEGVTQRLSKVNVYKVGHHGSLNATPKDLWNGFEARGSSKTANRLRSFLSTKDGVHGSAERHTEVPRASLVDALEKQSTLYDTRTLASDALARSEEHTSELQSLMRNSYAVFCLKK